MGLYLCLALVDLIGSFRRLILCKHIIMMYMIIICWYYKVNFYICVIIKHDNWDQTANSNHSIIFSYQLHDLRHAEITSLSLSFLISKMEIGFPVLEQQKQIQLGTMRLQFRSLASFSGLRIWCCSELWCRSQMQLRSDVAVSVI